MTHSLLDDPLLQPATPARIARKNKLNALNGSTAFGLFVARLGGCRITQGPRGMWLADNYRYNFPVAGAFTIGSVAITGQEWPDILDNRSWLFHHEEWHSFQYAACGGLPFIPLYVAAMGWSMLLTGDFWSRNPFERRAGLAIGGYVEHRLRRPLRLVGRGRRSE